MHVIRSEFDLQALEDPDLLYLIRQRIADTAEFVDTFGELVFFVAVRPGDDIAALDDAMGFRVMANRFDGVAFGEAGFAPSWDVLEEHPGFYELIYVLSDNGAGVTVFVAKADGVSPQLLSMCRQFANAEADT
jgi:hypothetical protein